MMETQDTVDAIRIMARRIEALREQLAEAQDGLPGLVELLKRVSIAEDRANVAEAQLANARSYGAACERRERAALDEVDEMRAEVVLFGADGAASRDAMERAEAMVEIIRAHVSWYDYGQPRLADSMFERLRNVLRSQEEKP